MADFLIGHVIVFWAIAMWFNMYNVQKKQRMGAHLAARIHGGRLQGLRQKVRSMIETADETYLGMFACCVLYMLQIAFRQNLNRIYCRSWQQYITEDSDIIVTPLHMLTSSVSYLTVGTALVLSYSTATRFYKKASLVESRTMERQRRAYRGSVLDDEND